MPSVDSNSAAADVSPAPSATGIQIPESVTKAYHLINKNTGSVGGNGSFGPIYGEMSIGSMQRMMNFFVDNCGFGSESVFIDIGAGLGKPNIHAACMPQGCKYSIGIECEATRYNLSLVRPAACARIVSPHDTQAPMQVNLQALVENPTAVQKRCNLFFLLANVLAVTSLQPVTHVFAFDVGMPHRVLRHMAALFHAAPSCKYIMVFRYEPPACV